MRIMPLLFAGWLAAGMTGCISSAPTEVEKRGAEYTVTVNSLILDNHIRVAERSIRRTNGLLEAQVRGQNVSEKDVQFEYRYIWLDKDGVAMETEISTWKPLALHAKESAFMTGISPSPEATDFLMSIRFVHQSTRW